MQVSDDIRDLLAIFVSYAVEFAVCGGHAVAFHGYPRFTMDVDLVVVPSEENADRVMEALRHFGFGEAGIPREVFTRTGTAVTLGAQPNEVDLLTSISSVPTAEIVGRAVCGTLAGIDVRFVARDDMMTAKREAGRPKDLADLDELERFTRED